MTNQEFYDNAKARIAKQGGAAVEIQANGEPGSCAYRTPDGKACAVGANIPDEKYIREMEFKPVEDVLILAGIDAELEFVKEMQRAHDDTLGPWRERNLAAEPTLARMAKVAVKYGLNP